MKKWLINWLGLNNLSVKLETLQKENAELKKAFDELEEKVNEIEIPDMDDYVLENDIDDKIDCYLSNNDYCTQSYVDDMIEELDIEEQVRDLFNDASPAPMTEDEIKKEVSEAVKITLEKVVKAIADNAWLRRGEKLTPTFVCKAF